MFGDDSNLAGGEAPKFFASCIGFFRRVGSLKENGIRIANKVEVEWKKNQIAPPFRKGIFYIRFPPHGAGFDNERAVIDVAESMGIVTKKGSSISYGGKRLGQGYEQARKRLLLKPEITEAIMGDIREADKKPETEPEPEDETPTPDEDDEDELGVDE
jgi:recombination protein RecA